jgi:prophage regulatory protein
MRFFRIKPVMQATGLSRMTIYRLDLGGKFPKRRQLTENSLARLESDISEWIDSPLSRGCELPLRCPAPSHSAISSFDLCQSHTKSPQPPCREVAIGVRYVPAVAGNS